ncbi:hypothetical protein Nepgr_024633 [Nepenthes gracilis]|uniref:Uncharacterized protein n=1 Tax=Nepenthes gracilis TaxID=150966 RepID=A0AAD3T3N1_NEPGR|nr:hypothetical protein Nepgr_024633 [Nepenthes gracilis]
MAEIVWDVPDYTDSVSFTSEPPDIRNWFSSYVYDSPEIDSMEVGVLVSGGTDRYSSKEVATPSKNREDSTIGKEIASNGFITCKKSGRQKTNENSSIGKDIEGLEQNHSLHAERTPEQASEEVALKCHDNGQAKVAAAPTVKNEGSTYLLEAQPTRENDFLPFDSHGSSVMKLRSKEKLLDSGKSTAMDLEAKAKTGNFNCQNNSEWILPLHRFVGGHCQISKRENESSISRENDCLPFDSRGSSAIKLRSEEKLHDGGVSMEKDLEAKAKIGGINGHNNPDWILPIPRFVGGHSQSRNRENRSGMSRENDYLPFGSHGSSINKRMSEEKLLDGGESMEKDSEAKANIGRINGQNNSDWSLPTCSSVGGHCRSSNRENKSSMPRKNAFTSTRKSTSARINDENSLKGLKCMNEVTKVKSVSAVDEKMKGTTKKALKESTNLQHSNMLEIAGKWRCPQKTKPNKGPPLKQLRLEGWIHRI